MSNKEQIENYVAYLEKGESEKALLLKKTFIPSSLYKYRPLTANTLDCLDYSSVWVSPALSQNDPFESSLSFSDKEFVLEVYKNPKFKDEFKQNYGVEIKDNEISEIINDITPEIKFREICKRKNIDRNYDDLSLFREQQARQMSDKLKKDIKLSCFSERNDSILMWSHYADLHKGICIEYDFRADDYVMNFIEPVIYSDKQYSLSKTMGEKSKENHSRIAAITKALDWQYEKEWRIIFPNSDSGRFKVPKPNGIYLGARIKENSNVGFIDRLQEKCISNGIPIHSMKLHDSDYKIINE